MMIPTDKSSNEELDSDDSDNKSERDVPLMKGIRFNKLIDIFQKLYSHFDEDVIEFCDDILRLRLHTYQVYFNTEDPEMFHSLFEVTPSFFIVFHRLTTKMFQSY